MLKVTVPDNKNYKELQVLKKELEQALDIVQERLKPLELEGALESVTVDVIGEPHFMGTFVMDMPQWYTVTIVFSVNELPDAPIDFTKVKVQFERG